VSSWADPISVKNVIDGESVAKKAKAPSLLLDGNVLREGEEEEDEDEYLGEWSDGGGRAFPRNMAYDTWR
jgi:hypothetical protein